MADNDSSTDSSSNSDSNADSPGGFSEADLRRIVGEEVDSRTGERLSRLEKLDLLDGIDDRIEAIVKKHKSSGSGKPAEFDKEGLLGEISTLIDGKLAGIGTTGNTPRKPGPLARFLGFGDLAS